MAAVADLEEVRDEQLGDRVAVVECGIVVVRPEGQRMFGDGEGRDVQAPHVAVRRYPTCPGRRVHRWRQDVVHRIEDRVVHHYKGREITARAACLDAFE